MSDHPIRLVLAGDIQHLRPHFHARRGHRIGLQLEPDPFLQLVQHGQRLAPCRIIVINIGDLRFAAPRPVVHHESDGGTGLRPVAGGNGEDIGKRLAVPRRGAAEAGRGAQNLILGQPRGHRHGVWGPIKADGQGAGCLVALVGFQATGHLVAVVDFEPADGVSAAQHILLVEQLDVIVGAVAEKCAHGLGGPGAVALGSDYEFLGVGRAMDSRQQQERQPKSQRQAKHADGLCTIHDIPLPRV